MARIFRAAIFMACFLSAGSVFAGTYYIAANGSDSSNGTSKTTPWLHAPGMPTCTANCASHTPTAGDQFIFRGGDAWHFGNSSATPYTGGTWVVGNWRGTSGNNIYWGVDLTWYTGASWTRPIMSGDNPPSTSTTLGPCTYQVPSANIFIAISSTSFVTMDNFEFTGLCTDTPQPAAFWSNLYIRDDSSTYLLFENIYMHGWTHEQFSCSAGPTGQCVEAGGWEGNGTQTGNVYQYIVVDGSDSDPAGFSMTYDGMYDVHNSVFRYTSQFLTATPHLIHDNLFEHFYAPGDGVDHGNVEETIVGDVGPTSAWYNNVFRNICVDSGACPGNQIVNFWIAPPVGGTDYIFNNVMYNIQTIGNYFNIGQNSADQGTMVVFNNTFEQPEAGPIINCNTTYLHPFTAANNHYVTDQSSPYSSPCTGGTYTTNLQQTHSAATSTGYTASETYAYSPISGSAPTVGAGTNEQAYCTALSSAGLTAAATACQSDTTYAVTYDSTTHAVTGPGRTVVPRPASAAWDKGAFQYAGAQASAPNPPTGLMVIVQ